EAIVMHRLAFGPRPGDVEAVAKSGLKAWLDDQLAPDDSKDELCNKRLDSAMLKIAYPAGKDKDVSWDKVEEDRPLKSIKQNIGDVWQLTLWNKPMAYEERVRPFREVLAATWIRAVYSKYQLREVMVDFWHNHFNVNAEVDVAAQV